MVYHAGVDRVNIAIIGSSYQHVTERGSLYQVAVFLNDETSVLGTARHIEADSLGLRSFARWPINSRQSLLAKLSLQTTEYGGRHPVFNNLRQDDSYTAGLGWQLNLTPVTVLSAEAEYLHNSSNIDIYSYDRKSAFISLRYDFDMR